MPKILGTTNRSGTPYIAVCFSLFVTCLGFTVAKASAYVVFQYFVSTVTLLATIVWTQIILTNLRFRRACKTHEIDPDSLPYRSKLNPFMCYWGVAGIVLIIVTKGFTSFIHEFQYKSFITNYRKSIFMEVRADVSVGLPVILVVYVFFSLFKYRSWMTPEEELDLRSGTRSLLNLQQEGESTPQRWDIIGWVKFIWNS